MSATKESAGKGVGYQGARVTQRAVGLVLVGVFSFHGAEAATMRLYPVADNWISSCSSGCGTNYGQSTEVWIRTAALWGEVKNFRGLLRFDFSELPVAGSRISSATLNLYLYDYHWENPEGRIYTVHQVISSWGELGSTWQARFDYDTAHPVYWDSYLAGVPSYQPGGGDFVLDEYSSAEVPAAGNWMTWDVTDLVLEWVNGDYGNEGLLIKDADEFEEYGGDDVAWGPAQFRSVDYYDEAYRPYLEVAYTLPGDIDQDGHVDLADFATFAMCYGGSVISPPPGCSPDEAEACDLDGDGQIDLSDFATFALYYGS